ncbi:DYW domain-containing protein [Plasmodiophora brassicae]
MYRRVHAVNVVVHVRYRRGRRFGQAAPALPADRVVDGGAALTPSALDDFWQNPSIPVAVRLLSQEVDPGRGWAIFRHVLGSGLRPREPFFRRALQFCQRSLPSKAPHVVRTAAFTGVSVSTNDGLFCTFLGACKAGNPPLLDEALDVYQRLRGPRSHNVICSLASLCRLAKRPESALPLLTDVLDHFVQFSEMLMSILAASCAEAQSAQGADTAERLLELVRSKRVPPYQQHQLYANLIKALLSQARFDAAIDALSLLDTIGVPPSNHVYAVVFSALTKSSCIDQAVTVFQSMMERSIPVFAPDLTTLIAACGRSASFDALQALFKGCRGTPLLDDEFAVNAFVAAFGHCNRPDEARRVLRAATTPNVSNFNALIAAYAKNGQHAKAIQAIDDLRTSRLPLTIEIYTNMLSVYAKADQLDEAMAVFREMVALNMNVDEPVLAILVTTCGRRADKQRVNMLAEYAERNVLLARKIVFTSFVAAYGQCCDLPSIKLLHRFAWTSGSSTRLLQDEFVVNAFISAYGHCQRPEEAHALFCTVKAPRVSTYNTMISAYSNNGMFSSAICVFEDLRQAGLECNIEVYNNVLSVYAKANLVPTALILLDELSARGLKIGSRVLACLVAGCNALGPLKTLHQYAEENALLSNDNVFPALVASYGQCRDLKTIQTLHESAISNGLVRYEFVVSAFIAAYGHCGRPVEAHDVLRSTPHQRASTFNALIAAYANNDMLDSAIATFEEVKAMPDLEVTLEIYNNVLSLFAKADRIPDAMNMFDEMAGRGIDVGPPVLCCLISACGRNAQTAFLRKLQQYVTEHALLHNRAVFNAFVTAYGRCSELSSIQDLHRLASENALLDDIGVANSLISSYGHCGHIDGAEHLFLSLKAAPILVTFNSMITTYGWHGMLPDALSTFERLKATGITPDAITLLSLLTACSHTGSLDDANAIAAEFEQVWRVPFDARHTNCMINLYGRAGNLDQAEHLALSSAQADQVTWTTVLSACRKHNDVVRAERVFSRIQSLPNASSHLAGAYVILSSIYASVRRHSDAERLREEMRVQGLAKKPQGETASLMLPDRTIHFSSDDTRNGPMTDPDLLETYRRLMRSLTASGHWLERAEDVDRPASIHVDKLVITYALMVLPPGGPIHVMSKNHRICFECHEIAKAVSVLYKREIFIRDTNRHHRFCNGRCSCNDYW